MTLMSFLLLVILFLVFFIYFAYLNPDAVTFYYFSDQSFTVSPVVLVVGAILIGLIFGLLAYSWALTSTRMRDWRKERKDKKTRENFAMYREGVGRLLSGDLKKARVLLQKALDQEPRRSDTLIAMASLNLQEGKPQEGINLLLKAREMEPRSLEVLFKLAGTYEELGQDTEAEQVYGEILTIDKDNRKALRGVRDLAVKQGRWREALDVQKRLIKVSQGSPRLAEEKKKLLYIKYEIACMDLAAGQIEPAKIEFTEVIRQDGEFVPARVSLGDANRLQGRKDDAARIWQEGYRSLRRGIFLARLEELYLEAEDPATLLAFYRNALAQNDTDVILRLYYARLCLRLELVEEAAEHVFALESAGADHPLVHFLAAEVHRRRRRIDEALEEYRLAMGMDNRLQVTFECESCGETYPEWLSRCTACGLWGSLVLSGRSNLGSITPLDRGAIPHGGL
ncbi:lipopolysaccharide assembly protein LapA domain-containing protein [Geoalkalibacter sp.]|uniref:lipopolysaccharide assembly protein LapA domain-containing protein n=1 Tax=Geoalkalibacter sp. TaxID=3041440 RepID=UPI00272E0B14|nr:lipopolysaccharide assembly protein LapA domain-containing protein [Geoalkalibacter sp.]